MSPELALCQPTIGLRWLPPAPPVSRCKVTSGQGIRVILDTASVVGAVSPRWLDSQLTLGG